MNYIDYCFLEYFYDFPIQIYLIQYVLIMFFSCQSLPVSFQASSVSNFVFISLKSRAKQKVTIKANRHHKMETIMTQKYQNKEHT